MKDVTNPNSPNYIKEKDLVCTNELIIKNLKTNKVLQISQDELEK